SRDPRGWARVRPVRGSAHLFCTDDDVAFEDRTRRRCRHRPLEAVDRLARAEGLQFADARASPGVAGPWKPTHHDISDLRNRHVGRVDAMDHYAGPAV